jgi:hypothetical protein
MRHTGTPRDSNTGMHYGQDTDGIHIQEKQLEFKRIEG